MYNCHDMWETWNNSIPKSKSTKYGLWPDLGHPAVVRRPARSPSDLAEPGVRLGVRGHGLHRLDRVVDLVLKGADSTEIGWKIA